MSSIKLHFALLRFKCEPFNDYMIYAKRDPGTLVASLLLNLKGTICLLGDGIFPFYDQQGIFKESDLNIYGKHIQV